MMQDFKLGLRMLSKYPGLTVAGGLALAVAIGIGAGWYEVAGDLLYPRLPLPEGDRIVEVATRNVRTGEDERRVLHDFLTWRRDVRSIADLGAYRTTKRNLILDNARPEPVTIAEITASAFHLARVPPLLGRTLIEADEDPRAPAVVVLGFDVWQQRFGGRLDVVGRTLQLGSTQATVVGVMPERFGFPINHRLWTPLELQASYGPLEGDPVRVFGRLAPGATRENASVEFATVAKNASAALPQTHADLRVRVLPYGAMLPSGGGMEYVSIHVPVLLVLIIACTNVATLIYARTSTRDAEIGLRYAVGASRARIIGQLFTEALVLSSAAALVGLTAAHWALKWGMAAAFATDPAGPPFWMTADLSLTTVLYAVGLTISGAAILGVLPALRATRLHGQAQLRSVGASDSALRFGGVWTTAMIAQVALTVVCIPPAVDVTREAMRDRQIRTMFPAREYLAVRVELDRDDRAAPESPTQFAERMARLYDEFARRVAQEAGVVAVTFGDRLPGMEPQVRRAEVEMSAEGRPGRAAGLWTATVGPGFFEAFEKPILAGRGFHNGDRAADARTVIVNEAFARRFLNGATPVGRRVRYVQSNPPVTAEPWFEIVGLVRDFGVTPTNLGEAPYVFHAAGLGTVYPPMMGVHVNGDPHALATRVRTIAGGLDPTLRLDDVRRLDDWVRTVDVPEIAIAGSLAGVVAIGLLVSAASIFSLMSVTVARRTREIGLRAALGASSARLLASIFSRVMMLVGSGIVVGNLMFILMVAFGTNRRVLSTAVVALAVTSALMLTVALLACVAPARRALTIQPTDALKEV
jgi:putative ABC transport system permease protein